LVVRGAGDVRLRLPSLPARHVLRLDLRHQPVSMRRLCGRHLLDRVGSCLGDDVPNVPGGLLLPVGVRDSAAVPCRHVHARHGRHVS
jgi:hypothetical protein